MSLLGRLVMIHRTGDSSQPIPPRPPQPQYHIFVGKIEKSSGAFPLQVSNWYLPKNTNDVVKFISEEQARLYVIPVINETVRFNNPANRQKDFFGTVVSVKNTRKANLSFEILWHGYSARAETERKWTRDDNKVPWNRLMLHDDLTVEEMTRLNQAAVDKIPTSEIPANEIMRRARMLRAARKAQTKKVLRNPSAEEAEEMIQEVVQAVLNANAAAGAPPDDPDSGDESETDDVPEEGNGLFIDTRARKGWATIKPLMQTAAQVNISRRWWTEVRKTMTIQVRNKTRTNRGKVQQKDKKQYDAWAKRRKTAAGRPKKGSLAQMIADKFYQDVEIQTLASFLGTRIHQYVSLGLSKSNADSVGGGGSADGGSGPGESDDDSDGDGDGGLGSGASSPSTSDDGRGASSPITSDDDGGVGNFREGDDSRATPSSGKRTGRRRQPVRTGKTVKPSPGVPNVDSTLPKDAVIGPDTLQNKLRENKRMKAMYDEEYDNEETQAVIGYNTGLVVVTDNNNWVTKNNTGGGECLFLALRDCIFDRTNVRVSADTIRQKIVDYMAEKKEYFEKNVDYHLLKEQYLSRDKKEALKTILAAPLITRSMRLDLDRAFAAYLKYMRLEKTWGTDQEIYAFVDMPLGTFIPSLKSDDDVNLLDNNESFDLMIFANYEKNGFKLVQGYRNKRNKKHNFLAVQSDHKLNTPFRGSHWMALIKEDPNTDWPIINAQFAPIGAVALPLHKAMPKTPQAKLRFETALTSLQEEGKLLKTMAEATLAYMKKLKIELVATELPVIDMHQAFMLHSAGGAKLVFLESRVDFVCKVGDKLVLGDFKNRVGNTTQYQKPKSEDIAQLVLYAWLMWTNYRVVIEELWLVATNREGDVMHFTFPFASVLDKGARKGRTGSRREGRKRADIGARLDVKNWITAYTQTGVLSSADFHYYPHKSNHTPEAFDEQSELLEVLLDQDAVLNLKTGPQRVRSDPGKKFLRSLASGRTNWKDVFRVGLMHYTSDTPSMKISGIFATFRMPRGRVGAARAPAEVPVPVDARFQSYVDVDERGTDAGWTLRSDAKRIGRHNMQTDIDYKGYKEAHDGAHVSDRLKLHALVNEEAEMLFNEWDVDAFDQDAFISMWGDGDDKMSKARENKKGETVEEGQVTVARKINSLVDRHMLAYMKSKGAVSDRVDPREPDNTNTERPYAAARFTNFEHMSQRVAWSNEMFAKAETFIQPSVDIIRNKAISSGVY